MGRRARVEKKVSAGGVVVRDGGSGPEVVLCGRKAPPLWALPKGTPEPGETQEQVALREVNEETGLQVQVEGFIESIEYWFVRPPDGVRVHKTVHFYLMSATGGDLSLHDHEFDDVRWFPADQAVSAMTYEGEVRVGEKGLTMASG